MTLGGHLALHGHHLIYGGGRIGLMGLLADTFLENKAFVTGVIPEFLLNKELGHNGLTECLVVETMHERKMKMAELADAFLALPGGWGTLDELAEIMTWRQLGIIRKPIFIFNINHFFDPLFSQLRLMTKEGFVNHACFSYLTIFDQAQEIVKALSK